MTARISFKGCRTRAHARQRFIEWLDQYEEDLVRQLTTEWLLDPAEDEDIENSVAQLRAALVEYRRQTLAQFEAAADELADAR